MDEKHFFCSECGQPLKADESIHGATASCPNCGKTSFSSTTNPVTESGKKLKLKLKRTCIGCRSTIGEEDLICLTCGLNQQTGKYPSYNISRDKRAVLPEWLRPPVFKVVFGSIVGLILVASIYCAMNRLGVEATIGNTATSRTPPNLAVVAKSPQLSDIKIESPSPSFSIENSSDTTSLSIAAKSTLPSQIKDTPPEEPKDEAFWQRRAAELAKPLLSEFKPPKLGSKIAIFKTVGGVVTGVLEALSYSNVVVGGRSYQRNKLADESRARLFARDWAYAQIANQLIAERHSYNERLQAMNEAIDASIASAKEDKYYESAMTTLKYSIRINCLATNRYKAEQYLAKLKIDFAKYEEEQIIAAEHRAKGEEWYEGQWLRAEQIQQRMAIAQQQEQELANQRNTQNDLQNRYGSYYGPYRTYGEALQKARSLMAMQDGQLGAARELGGTYIGGAPVQNFKPHFDNNTGLYVVY